MTEAKAFIVDTFRNPHEEFDYRLFADEGEALDYVANMNLEEGDGPRPAVVPLFEQAEWQPIETAPKDGTEILATNGVWREVLMYDGHYWCSHLDSEQYSHSFEPAHWQPLPAPPETT